YGHMTEAHGDNWFAVQN
ncbi:hypothetical protein KIPB_006414, partial [Kipferlia bialata]